jgi:hypothetical protein
MSRVLAVLLLLPIVAHAQDVVITHVRLFDGERVHDGAAVLVHGVQDFPDWTRLISPDWTHAE